MKRLPAKSAENVWAAVARMAECSANDIDRFPPRKSSAERRMLATSPKLSLQCACRLIRMFGIGQRKLEQREEVLYPVICRQNLRFHLRSLWSFTALTSLELCGSGLSQRLEKQFDSCVDEAFVNRLFSPGRLPQVDTPG
jgi:hypothetical protein